MKRIVNSRLFERSIFILIVINLIAMIIESEPDLNPTIKYFLSVFETFSIVIFSIEYILRTINSVKERGVYNLSFFGVIDLFSILPFYLQSLMGFDGRFVRIFRLFRISRIIKLGRFSKSFKLLSVGNDRFEIENISVVELTKYKKQIVEAAIKAEA